MPYELFMAKFENTIEFASFKRLHYMKKEQIHLFISENLA